MSCAVSEFQTGCRLRGAAASGIVGDGCAAGKRAASAASAAANNPSRANITTAVEGQRSAHKQCYFCWCCCCSCSWAKCLALKKGEGNAPTVRDHGNTDLLNGEHLTFDEVKLWSLSFDNVMKSASGRKIFRDFLKSEFSEENILFWLACEDLKTETNPDMIKKKAQDIYNLHISTASEHEVSLDSKAREVIEHNMATPTANLFDEAQMQIYQLMCRDSYPRFLSSQNYRILMPLGGEGSSSVTGSKQTITT